MEVYRLGRRLNGLPGFVLPAVKYSFSAAVGKRHERPYRMAGSLYCAANEFTCWASQPSHAASSCITSRRSIVLDSDKGEVAIKHKVVGARRSAARTACIPVDSVRYRLPLGWTISSTLRRISPSVSKGNISPARNHSRLGRHLRRGVCWAAARVGYAATCKGSGQHWN